jgi:hypothetical protein
MYDGAAADHGLILDHGAIREDGAPLDTGATADPSPPDLRPGGDLRTLTQARP